MRFIWFGLVFIALPYLSAEARDQPSKQDAARLLGLALSCPGEAKEVYDWTADRFDKQIAQNEFSGNEVIFELKTLFTDMKPSSAGVVQTKTSSQTLSAPFEALAFEYPSDGNYIQLVCHTGDACINQISGGKYIRTQRTPIQICDQDSVSNVAYALAVLMRPESEGATRQCVVADPTRTPLNLRGEPSRRGMLMGTISNGTKVEILRQTVVNQRFPWALIIDADWTPRGWVYQKYLNCD
jgi:hypothetical protein